MIKLYVYSLGGFLNKAALNSKTEINRVVSEKSYELLRNKLFELTGAIPEIKKTDRGKPYVANLPVYVSISHAGDMVFFAIADGEIGVDIELTREFSLHMKARLFSDNELNYIRKGDENERSTILWSLREAVCKATGEGFSEWFFSCSLVDSYGALLTRYGDFHLDFFENNGYICTVACILPTDKITLFTDSL